MLRGRVRIADRIDGWTTRQNKEVGEVLEVSGGRRFVVAAKEFEGREREMKDGVVRYLEIGIYDLVEEETGEQLSVGYEYEVDGGEK